MQSRHVIPALLMLSALCAFGQTPDFLISSGVSFDYATKQPSVVVAVAPKVGTIAGVPTYSYSSFETANLKLTQGVSSQSVTVKTGFLQLPVRRQHWGVFVLSDGGVTKFDAATLSTFSGGVGLYFDLVGVATKDKYHGWVSPLLREVSIAGMQVKPVYGVQVTTVFSREKE